MFFSAQMLHDQSFGFVLGIHQLHHFIFALPKNTDFPVVIALQFVGGIFAVKWLLSFSGLFLEDRKTQDK